MDIARKRSGAELRWRFMEKKKQFTGKNESGTKEENNEV